MKTSKRFNLHWAPLLLIILLFFGTSAQSQTVLDSLVLKNGDVIMGEIKSLDKGVITVETDYSKNDFTIEWYGVREVFCKTRFLIILKNGDRLNGTFYTKEGGKTLLISGTRSHKDTANFIMETSLEDVVYLKGLKGNFWSRMHASIDIGLNLTRANNLRQWSSNTKLGYLADNWSLDAYYNDLISKQDSIKPVRRTESGATYNYYLPNDWYAGSSLTFLKNTEQALALRTTAKLGLGKFLIHTNKKYWGLSGGLSGNNENFSNEKPSRKSLEAYVGSELNLFDIGDLSLFNSVFVYPSLTESGRLRSDIKLDTKYEFFEDFYVKLGLTINYDNRPAVAGRETDYIFAFNIGWEL
jgi:hypothetical protein